MGNLFVNNGVKKPRNDWPRNFPRGTYCNYFALVKKQFFLGKFSMNRSFFEVVGRQLVGKASRYREISSLNLNFI